MTDTPPREMPGMDEATAEALAVLAADVGTFDTELTITAGPGADPVTTTGVTVNRMVGERWLVTDQSTDSGLQGHGIYGWDAAARRYVSVWVDADGADIISGTGAWDAAAGTMTFDVHVDMDGARVSFQEITERHPDGSRIYRNVLALPDGGRHEMIRGTFRPR